LYGIFLKNCFVSRAFPPIDMYPFELVELGLAQLLSSVS
jgi:hypothetical protein